MKILLALSIVFLSDPGTLGSNLRVAMSVRHHVDVTRVAMWQRKFSTDESGATWWPIFQPM